MVHEKSLSPVSSLFSVKGDVGSKTTYENPVQTASSPLLPSESVTIDIFIYNVVDQVDKLSMPTPIVW